jgi:hypothetical protein
VTKLVRGKGANASALADSSGKSPQCLLARGGLRVFPPSFALTLVDPDLDLHREDVVVRLRLQLAVAPAKLAQHIRVDRQPVPVSPFPLNTYPPSEEVAVFPPAAEYLRATEADAFHQEDSRALVPDSRRSDRSAVTKSSSSAAPTSSNCS